MLNIKDNYFKYNTFNRACKRGNTKYRLIPMWNSIPSHFFNANVTKSFMN